MDEDEIIDALLRTEHLMADDRDTGEPKPTPLSAFDKDTALGNILDVFNNLVPGEDGPHPPKAWLQLFRAMCFTGVGYQWAQQQGQQITLAAALARDFPEWWATFMQQVPSEMVSGHYYRQVRRSLEIVLATWPTVESFEHIYDNDPPAPTSPE